jgi:PEP-CTERM motif-containing protein
VVEATATPEGNGGVYTGTANAEFFDSNDYGELDEVFSACSPSCNQAVVPFNIPALIDVGDIIYAELSATAFATNNSLFLGMGNSSGTVDPYIYINPSFPDADLYSVIVSAGAGVGDSALSTSVPEPGSLALFLSALAGLGAIGVSRVLSYKHGCIRIHDLM